jgi:hypothetical protein
MLIPGSLGETKKSREPAAALAARINAAHGKPGGGPIFLGANCLGVVSHPGATIPGSSRSSACPSRRRSRAQFGHAEPERRLHDHPLSQNPWLDPRYMLAWATRPTSPTATCCPGSPSAEEIESIGIYIEGFKDLDGLAFATRCARRC